MTAKVMHLWRNLDPGSLWATYTVLGMVGLWGGALLFMFRADDPMFLELIDRGQLSLYSVALLTSSLYLVLRDSNTMMFPHRAGLTAACFSVIVFSVLMFSGATLASTDPKSNAPDGLVAVLGGILLVASLVIGYFVARAEEKKKPFSYEAERERGRQKVEEEYDDELEAQGGS